jgi:hypothetical protein
MASEVGRERGTPKRRTHKNDREGMKEKGGKEIKVWKCV